MFVQPDAGELPGDAEALEVGVSAQVDIAAKHPGADQRDLDCAIRFNGRANCVCPGNPDAKQFWLLRAGQPDGIRLNVPARADGPRLEFRVYAVFAACRLKAELQT